MVKSGYRVLSVESERFLVFEVYTCRSKSFCYYEFRFRANGQTFAGPVDQTLLKKHAVLRLREFEHPTIGKQIGLTTCRLTMMGVM